MRKELAYASIGALYVIAQLLTAIRAEVFPFLPEPYNLMFGGLFAYIGIFCVANIINESEGKDEGKKIIAVGIFANILFLLNLHLENLIPEVKGIFPDYTSQTFKWLISIEWRIVLGSLLAFAIAMWINNKLYTREWSTSIIVKYLAAINVAQVADTIVFHLTAYTGIVEFNALVGSILSTLILKMILTFVSVPVFLIGLKGYDFLGYFSLHKFSSPLPK